MGHLSVQFSKWFKFSTTQTPTQSDACKSAFPCYPLLLYILYMVKGASKQGSCPGLHWAQLGAMGTFRVAIILVFQGTQKRSLIPGGSEARDHTHIAAVHPPPLSSVPVSSLPFLSFPVVADHSPQTILLRRTLLSCHLYFPSPAVVSFSLSEKRRSRAGPEHASTYTWVSTHTPSRALHHPIGRDREGKNQEGLGC